jgi:hypothetical protein
MSADPAYFQSSPNWLLVVDVIATTLRTDFVGQWSDSRSIGAMPNASWPRNFTRFVATFDLVARPPASDTKFSSWFVN